MYMVTVMLALLEDLQVHCGSIRFHWLDLACLCMHVSVFMRDRKGAHGALEAQFGGGFVGMNDIS